MLIYAKSRPRVEATNVKKKLHGWHRNHFGGAISWNVYHIVELPQTLQNDPYQESVNPAGNCLFGLETGRFREEYHFTDGWD